MVNRQDTSLHVQVDRFLILCSRTQVYRLGGGEVRYLGSKKEVVRARVIYSGRDQKIGKTIPTNPIQVCVSYGAKC